MYKVLIVEDDPMVASINAAFLEKYTELEVVGIVKTENEIFNILKNNHIDLIFCDVFLEKYNGIEILKKVRNMGFLTDFIFVTALNESNKIKEALAFGAIDFLIKPYSENRVDSAINKFLKKNKLLIKNTLVQEEYDNYTLSYYKQPELPKGINEKTLIKIESFLNENHKKWWSSSMLSANLNISNVTMNKYLKYLVTINKLVVHTTYGEIGRPEHFYKVHINN